MSITEKLGACTRVLYSSTHHRHLSHHQYGLRRTSEWTRITNSNHRLYDSIRLSIDWIQSVVWAASLGSLSFSAAPLLALSDVLPIFTCTESGRLWIQLICGMEHVSSATCRDYCRISEQIVGRVHPTQATKKEKKGRVRIKWKWKH